jgi:hypothetical protein
MFCGGCGSSTTATPMTRKRADPRPSDTTIIQPVPPRSTVISVPLWPVDQSQVVTPDAPSAPDARPPALSEPPAEVERARYTLQFSTGETVSVRGTGLIGRRPLPQPTERFDHLIQITDLGMSVSKSHLEFGQHDGEFWVNDRFSGNGTVVRPASGPTLRCEPGRRYLVSRGSRVEIGDQFFVIL